MYESVFEASDMTAGVRWLSEPIVNQEYCGDVWSSAWADDERLYCVADDTWVPGDGPINGSNLAIYRIDGTPRDTTIALVNRMEAYGHAAWLEGRATWKANGMTCVDGVLYLSVSQHAYVIPGTDHIQRTNDSTIVKSTDYGKTWSNKPEVGKPMFPGHWFSTPFFVQYGQDYSGAMDEYVYAVSNNGSWNNGNYLVLGRVLREKIGDLNPGDWEFFAGLDGHQSPTWTGDYILSPAIFIDMNRTSMTGIQYVPAADRFILMQWAFTDLTNLGQTMLCLYDSRKPWGPWRRIHTEPDWNHGSYNPGMPAKWFEDGGKRIWLTSAGDCGNKYCAKDSFAYYRFTVQQLELIGR